MLRRMLLCGLVAASLGLPSLTRAAPVSGAPDATLPSTRHIINQQQLSPGNASLGGGNFTPDPSHVIGPGTAPADTESRGPINDVVPGAGTADTRQSKNPKPVP